MKVLSYGASPISDDLLLKAKARFRCDFVQFYGMTETTGVGTLLRPETHDPAKGKLRSCGIAWPGVAVEIVDANGAEVPPGAVGEVVIKSPVVMQGYWNKPEATAASIHDGWMRTGDAAYRDHDGYIYIYDRVKDMIVTALPRAPHGVGEGRYRQLAQSLRVLAGLGAGVKAPLSLWPRALCAVGSGAYWKSGALCNCAFVISSIATSG
jgi:hypothetical protein